MDTFTSARTGNHVVRQLTGAFASGSSTSFPIAMGDRLRNIPLLVTDRQELTEGIKFIVLDPKTTMSYATTITRAQLGSPVTFIKVSA